MLNENIGQLIYTDTNLADDIMNILENSVDKIG